MKTINDVVQDDGSVVRTVTITYEPTILVYKYTADQYQNLVQTDTDRIAVEQDQNAQMQAVLVQSQQKTTPPITPPVV